MMNPLMPQGVEHLNVLHSLSPPHEDLLMTSVLELPKPLRAAQYAPSALQDVLNFVTRHPWLKPVIEEADEPLCAAFPGPVQLEIAVDRDPDIPNEEYLIVAVKTTLPPAQARTYLKAFDEAWLLDNADRFQDKVLYTLRFV
jgi:hypothetical protein